ASTVAPRDERDAVLVARAYHALHLCRAVRQDDEAGPLAQAREAVGFVREQLRLVAKDPVAPDDALEDGEKSRVHAAILSDNHRPVLSNHEDPKNPKQHEEEQRRFSSWSSW